MMETGENGHTLFCYGLLPYYAIFDAIFRPEWLPTKAAPRGASIRW
jgi:hypothetical protein